MATRTKINEGQAEELALAYLREREVGVWRDSLCYVQVEEPVTFNDYAGGGEYPLRIVRVRTEPYTYNKFLDQDSTAFVAWAIFTTTGRVSFEGKVSVEGGWWGIGRFKNQQEAIEIAQLLVDADWA